MLSGDLWGDDDPNDPFNNNLENTYHVVTGSGTDDTAILDGLTITAGNANESDAKGDGGGMFIDAGSPMVIRCTFELNAAFRYGAGIYLDGAGPLFVDCIFRSNVASGGYGYGGGVYATNASNFSMMNCLFVANYGRYGGGLIHRDGSVVDLTTVRSSQTQ